MNIITIDPGKSGGIVFYCPTNLPPILYPMPETEGDLFYLLNDLKHENARATVYVEEVGGFIKGNAAPGSAMFNFGRSYGYILGCCAGLKLPVHLVKPQVWQKALKLPVAGGDKPAHKRRLKEEAQRRYPELKVTLKTCDALLMLDYVRLQEANHE